MVLDDEPVYSNYRPENNPVFAEYSEPAPASSNDHEIDDTGLTVRALLPISSALIGESIKNYTGFATLLNSHVACVKPIIEDLTFKLKQEFGNSQFKSLISGRLSLGTGSPGIVFDPRTVDLIADMPEVNTTHGAAEFVTFTCEMGLNQIVQDEWPISMCVAGNRLKEREVQMVL